MKKNYFSLIGFIVLVIINYSLNHHFIQSLFENLNYANLNKVLKQSLLPPIVFMIAIFFSRKSFKLTTFSIGIIGFMCTEFLLRFYNGKEIIEHNYLIGMVLGLVIVFIIHWSKQRLVELK